MGGWRMMCVLLVGVMASEEEGGVLFERGTVESFDGTMLKVAARENNEAKTAVIMPNSWAMPSFEYHVPMARLFGRSVEYETRGFYMSGGEIGLAGPADLQDVRAVIDWTFRRWPDLEDVALCGVSYGGGLSLLGAAFDSRVAKVVAYSAWPNLYDELNPNESPNRMWASLLLRLGAATGDESSEVWRIWNDVRTHENLTYVREWAAERAPAAVSDKLADVPVLLLSNLDDGLFFSQHTFTFWESLQSPQKAIIFGAGTHAQSEVRGLLGFEFQEDGPWHRARDWIEGKSCSVAQQRRVTFLDVENGDMKLDFPQWPPDAKTDLVARPRWGNGKKKKNLFFFASSPFGDLVFDDDDDARKAGRKRPSTTSKSIHFGSSSVSSGRLPIVKSALKAVTKLPRADLGEASRESTSLVFLATGAQQDDYIICGIPELRGLAVVPLRQSSFQLYAYLYAAPPTKFLHRDRHLEARLVATVPFTVWNNATPGVPYLVPPLQFQTTAFLVPKGHRLALAFNMKNELFTPATTSRHAELQLALDDTALILPTVPTTTATTTTR